MNLTFKYSKRIEELTKICIQYQGEYRIAGHGSGSWATTYSNEFIDASAEMYLIFKESGAPSPIACLSSHLKKAEVCSCRGSRMNLDRVEYLYTEHLKSAIKYGLKIKNPTYSEKISCPFCEKEVSDLVLHVSQQHPNIWDKFESDPAVKLRIGKRFRCRNCGAFVKSIEKHTGKCPQTLVLSS